MRYTIILFCFSCCSLLLSCKFNPNVQDSGTTYLQGKWEESKVDYEDELLQYTRHQFVFTCDSFYAVLKTTAKANQYADSCFNNGNWQEYAKGVYKVSGDTLYIYSTFTNADFKQKLSGCYRIGQYLPVFIIKNYTPDSLHLQDLLQHLPVKLRLKQKTVCIPKPL